MGFRELQRKKTGNFWEESKAQKQQYITYEPSSFFLNLSTGELCLQPVQEQNTERENMKVKNNSYNLGQNICILFHSLVQFLFTTNKTELGYYHHKGNVQVASQSHQET